MTNREKIIVAMAGVALLYGMYTTFGEPDVHEVPASEISPATIALVKEVLADEPADSEAVGRVLANARLEWHDDAFLLAGFVPEQEAGLEQPLAIPDELGRIAYQGYLEMAGERIAILNNAEYRTGEAIDGFVITAITPTKILLSSGQEQYEIFFQEPK